MRNSDYEIDEIPVPGQPSEFQVKADWPHGPKFSTRSEAEDRRDELQNRRTSSH